MEIQSTSRGVQKTKPPRTNPKLWAAPFNEETCQAYVDFLNSDDLGYKALKDKLWKKGEALVAVPNTYSDLFARYAVPKPVTTLGPEKLWLTQAAGKGRAPVALLHLLASECTKVYGLSARQGVAFPVTGLSSYIPKPRRFARDFVLGNTCATGFVFERSAVLIVCGSDDGSDWKENLTAKRTQFRFGDGFSNTDGTDVLEDVHLGFARHLDRIFGAIIDWLEGLPDEINGVICAGHSLGGAVAVLAAQLLAGRGYNVQTVATFGAPAPGGAAFTKSYALGMNTWRFAHVSDPVPRLTSANLGFVHVGQCCSTYTLEGPLGMRIAPPAGPTFRDNLIDVLPFIAMPFSPVFATLALSVKDHIPKSNGAPMAAAAHSMQNAYLADAKSTAQSAMKQAGLQVEESYVEDTLWNRHCHYLAHF